MRRKENGEKGEGKGTKGGRERGKWKRSGLPLLSEHGLSVL